MKILNIKADIKKGKLKRGSVKRRCPDISKLKKLGYRRKYSLDLGIKKTLNWYQNNI